MAEPIDFSDPGKPVNVSRVTFFLPCKKAAEVDAFMRTLDHLKSITESGGGLIKGYTASNYPEAVYFGKWVSDREFVMQDGTVVKKGEVVTDRHVLVHFDIEDIGIEEDSFRATIAELHQKIAHIYFDQNVGQFTFWVVANRGVRLSYAKYEAEFFKLSKEFVPRPPN